MTGNGAAQILANLAAFEKVMQARAEAAMQEVGAALERWAKEEHAFTNRTGELEASIEGFLAASGPSLISTVLKADTPYAHFVELARSGRWAYLWPVIERHQDEILEIIARKMAL